MSFLFDTNVVSASRRPERQDIAFRTCLDQIDSRASFLSAITIMELRFGAQMERHRNPVFADDLEKWLSETVLAGYAGRILPFDAAIALRTGILPTPHKRPSPDAMIAGTALHHGLTVVTRNVADFEPLGVPCLNPWAFRSGTGQA